jgi:outer membrane protein
MIKKILVGFSLILGISELKAQDVMSLQSCIDAAVKNNLSLKSAEITTKNADVTMTTAYQQMYPSLNGSNGSFVNFGRSIDPTTNQFIQTTFFSNQWGLNAGMNLYSGGRIKNGIEQSKLDYKSAQLSEEQIRRDIILQVCIAYLNTLFSKENIALARNRRIQTNQQLQFIRSLVTYGTRPENETFDLEAQLATDDQSIIQAENSLEINLLRLKQAMNLDPKANIDVENIGDLGNLTDPFTVSIDDLTSRGQANQPSIKARETAIQSAEYGVKIAKGAALPNIGIGGNLNTNYSNQGRSVDRFEKQIVNQTVLLNNQPVTFGVEQNIPILSNTPYFKQFGNNLAYGFGLNITMPIMSNYTIRGGIKRAQLQVDQTRVALSNEKQTLQSNLVQALTDAKAAKATLAANNKTVEAQRKSFEVARKRYEAGAINNYDFTVQKTRVDIAENNLLVAKYDYIFKTKVLDFYLGNNIKLN